jgi:MFS family permease
VDELQLSYGEVGWLNMVSSLAWMVSYVVWGRLLDRRGGLWIVQINVILTLVVPMAFWAAQDMWLAAVAFLFNGIIFAGTDLGWMNAILQFARREDIGHYTSLHALLLGVRGIIAPFLGTALIAIPFLGLRGVFLLSAFIILVGWLLIRRVTVPVRSI